MFDFHLWIEGLVKQHLMRRLIFEISLILNCVIFILIEDLIVNQLDMVLLISLLTSWTFFIFVKNIDCLNYDEIVPVYTIIFDCLFLLGRSHLFQLLVEFTLFLLVLLPPISLHPFFKDGLFRSDVRLNPWRWAARLIFYQFRILLNHTCKITKKSIRWLQEVITRVFVNHFLGELLKEWLPILCHELSAKLHDLILLFRKLLRNHRLEQVRLRSNDDLLLGLFWLAEYEIAYLVLCISHIYLIKKILN